MMTLLEVETSMLLSRDVVKGLEKSQRTGEFWLVEETTRSMKKAGSKKLRLQERVLLGIGDFLISFGLKLKERGKSDSPAAFIQVR